MQIHWHAITVSRKPIFVESSTVGDYNKNIHYVVIEKLYIGIYACDNYRKIWSKDGSFVYFRLVHHILVLKKINCLQFAHIHVMLVPLFGQRMKLYIEILLVPPT